MRIERVEDIRHSKSAVVWLRVISSLAWLDSAVIGKDAKMSPAFLSGDGLAERVTGTFIHTAVAPGVADFLQNVVLPHVQIYAVLIAVGDLVIGTSLLLGVLTRVGGCLAIARAVTNILVVGGAGPDTIGFNVMLITAGVIATTTGAGRRYGIDGRLLARWPSVRLLRFLA